MDANGDRDALIGDALDALIHVVRMHHRNIDRIGDEAGMNRSPCMLLMQVNRSGTLPSQRELADCFDISPACIARSLKSLVAEGLIRRSESSEDQRCNTMEITEEGRARAARVEARFHAFDRDVFRDMTDREVETLLSLIRRLERNIRAVEARDGKCDGMKGCDPV